MSDLWLAAGEDAEHERHQRHVAMARTAAADTMTFVLGAATVEEFEHRLALVADRFDDVVASVTADAPKDFLAVRVALLDEVNEDFGKIHAQRQAEARAERQRVEARRRAELAARQKAAAAARAAKAKDDDELIKWTDDSEDDLIDWSSEKNKRKIKPLKVDKGGKPVKRDENGKFSARTAAFDDGSPLGRVDAAFAEAGFTYIGTTMFDQDIWTGPSGVRITLIDWSPYASHAIFGFTNDRGWSDGGSVNFDSDDVDKQIRQLVGRLKAMVTKSSARTAAERETCTVCGRKITTKSYESDGQTGVCSVCMAAKRDGRDPTPARTSAWSRARVAVGDRQVPTWVSEANGRELVVVANNGGFTWAVYDQGDEPLAKGRAAKLEQAQGLAQSQAGQ